MHCTQNMYIGDSLEKQIDLEKLVNEIKDYEFENTFVAFYNDKFVDVDIDLNSIKEALKDSDKIFLQLGYFEYDEEFLGEPCFIFDGEDTVDDLEDDEYYDKYKSEDSGYGIYLDKNLNVEYGYFTTETFHDFKDTRDDDEVKSEISSLLEEADIWKSVDQTIVNSKYDKEVNLAKLFDLKTDILCFVNDKCFNIKQEEDILSELNKEKSRYGWMPIVGISNMVLDNGGKLYFKLTNDEGIFVIRKNSYKDVSQVGKYTPEEGEILFDKESNEDIYINTHIFKPEFTNISEVNMWLKDKKINLKDTIERVKFTDIISYDTIVNVEDYWDNLCGEFDLVSYSDEYYEKLEELKNEGKYIYIRTVHASEGSGSFEKIYEYEINDDEFTIVNVYSCLENCSLRLSSQYYTGDEAGDYGIMIEDNEIRFYENTSGMFGGLERVRDLSEPLNAFVIEIMMNIIVFED